MVPGKTYSLLANYITLGGVRLTGFGESDVVSYEMASDIMEDSVSADGQVTTSYLNDDRVYVDLTFRENSIGMRRVADLMKAQVLAVRGGAAVPRLEYLHRDSLSGDEIFSSQATFKTRPGPSKGKTAQDRVFRLVLPNAAAPMLLASLIVQ